MANPAWAKGPFVLIEVTNEGAVRLSVWEPPAGIWRQTQAETEIRDWKAAPRVAEDLATSIGGAMIQLTVKRP